MPPMVGAQREHPFVGWFVDVSERVPSVHVAGVTMRGRDAAVTGWEALRAVFHARGSLQESWCWVLPSVLSSLSARSCKTASTKRGDFGMRFPTCPISSVVGRSCCRAPTQEPTTHCAPSHLRCPRIIPWRTMKVCGKQRALCWGIPHADAPTRCLMGLVDRCVAHDRSKESHSGRRSCRVNVQP